MTQDSKEMGGRVVRGLSVIFLILTGIFIGRYIIPLSATETSFNIEPLESADRKLVFPTFWEAWDHLHDSFIGTLDDKDLLYGAVAGMVSATGDPYTIFSNPDDAKQFEETLSGSFSGIGVEIGVQNGLVTVIAPLKGSPADQAGVREGDVIIAVDKEPLSPEMSLDDVVQKIRGPAGEEVVLTVARKDENQTEDIAIVRGTIEIDSVTSEVKDGIAHIQIISFNEDTTKKFGDVVKGIDGKSVSGIVLDLRGNPGGFLQSSVDIASYFVGPGTLIVTERGKDETPYKTRGGGTLRDIPLVVLIDGGSASASEILAGALKDHLHTAIIGEKSFGKGSVQELIPLKDGSHLRVTVAKWYTPGGRSIDDEGIEPSIVIEDDEHTDEDEQLRRAMEELRLHISG